jgi:hypothetical protein
MTPISRSRAGNCHQEQKISHSAAAQSDFTSICRIGAGLFVLGALIKGRDPMLDALLCYQMIANMIRAGYFLLLADLGVRAWASIRGAAALTARGFCRTATAPNGTLPPETRRLHGRHKELRWRLKQLESHVTSMA